MAAASDLERFFGYVRAFELANLTSDWSLLEPCFTEDACHLVDDGGILGGDDHGRAAVIDGLRGSVYRADRRFDVRIPEILEGPVARPDGIWMRWALTFRRAGLPELRVTGEHLAVYAGGRIRRLEERVDPGAAERVGAYLAEHAAALRPEGAPLLIPVGQDLRDLEAATARSLVRCYAGAKSQQDAGAALTLCSEDFVLETTAFGTKARSRAEAAAQLAVFFRAFPDYGVELEGFAEGKGVVATWGRVRMSLRGEILGLAPTGKTADLPMFCLLACEGGTLRSERFFFDRAELCEQLGLPVASLSEALSRLRAL